jgi:hypothetical protein
LFQEASGGFGGRDFQILDVSMCFDQRKLALIVVVYVLRGRLPTTRLGLSPSLCDLPYKNPTFRQ